MNKNYSYAVIESNFVKEKDFSKLAKGKEVKDYPNPYVKDVDGLRIKIIPANEKIVFRPMTEEEKKWYSVKEEGVVYVGRMTVLGWFPTELVCGVMRVPGYYDRFSANSPLAKETGWIDTNDNFGSRSDAFKAGKVNQAIRRLKDVGFVVEFQYEQRKEVEL